MTEYLPLSVGVGLAVSLLFSELFGLAAGGMIVPGYLALHVHRPLDMALTIGAALLTFGIVHTLSSFMIIYGRRRTIAMILVGYLVGTLFRFQLSTFAPLASGSELEVVGFIIPGLIAIWFDRQGVIETTTSLITAAIVVRLLLTVIVGLEIGP